MASETFYFKGKCKWARVFTPDTAFEPHAYRIDVYLSKEDVEIFKKIGLRNKVKTDEDGTFVSLKRKVGTKPWAPDEQWGPPAVVDAKGNKLESLIGNGSTVYVELDTYDAGKFGKASRLEKVVVLDLVKYEKPAEEPAGEDENGVPETPKAKNKPAGMPF